MLLLLLLGVLGVSAQVFTCGGGNNATVCSALGDLYYATNGASWLGNDGWRMAAAGTPTDYCTFSQVSCISGVLNQLCVRRDECRHCSVLRRPAGCALSSLNGNQLNGTIPSSMGIT